MAEDGDDRNGGSDANGVPEPDAAAVGQDPRQAILDAIGASGVAKERQNAIQILQRRRSELNAQKRELSRQVRNEGRKRSRLIQKSSKLSVPDLVEALALRQARAKAKAKAAPGA